MLETLGSFVVSFLVAFLRGWLSDIRSAEAQKQAGRDEVATKINKESADAEKRMAEVSDNPTDDDVARRMQSGTF